MKYQILIIAGLAEIFYIINCDAEDITSDTLHKANPTEGFVANTVMQWYVSKKFFVVLCDYSQLTHKKPLVWQSLALDEALRGNFVLPEKHERHLGIMSSCFDLGFARRHIWF